MANEILNPMKIYLQSGNGMETLMGASAATYLAQAVTDALLRYDQDRPLRATATIAGAGTGLYDLSAASLTGWDEDFSTVMRVDHPWEAGQDDELRLDEWEVFEDPTNGKTLRLIGAAAAAGETIRIQYTVRSTEGTVRTGHRPAVAKLAAANVCRMMAARTLQAGESTFSADRFHLPTASDGWKALAKHYEGQYEEAMGMGSDGDAGQGTTSVTAACAVWPVDTGDRVVDSDVLWGGDGY